MIFPKGADPKRILEEQAAFEETERKRAEARARAIFDSLVDFCPTAIEIFDLQGNLTKSNKAAERLLEKVPPPGINLWEEKGLKRTGLLEPQIRRILAGARVETPPFWYDPAAIGLIPLPGKKVCLRTTALPLFDAEGTVKQIAVVYEDLTELKKNEETLKELKNTVPENYLATLPPDAREIEFARRKIQEALRESEERYRTLLESVTGACIIRLSEDGRIIAISPSVNELLGMSRETVMTDNSLLFANIHPEDLPGFRKIEEEARKTGIYPPGYQFRVIKKPDNVIVWLEIRGKACTFASRRTFEILLIDVTEQKRLAAVIARQERDLATLLNSPNDGVFALNREWIITAWSKGAERETRVRSDEAIGKRISEVYPELEKTGMALTIRHALVDRQPGYQEFFYSDGRERLAGWFALSTYPVSDGLIALVRNITNRKKIEEAWQDADSRLRPIMDNPLVLIAFKDRDLRYVSANATAQKILGGNQDIIGKTDAELFPATVTALIGSYDRQVLNEGRTTTVEFALGDPRNEGTVWLALTKQPWRDVAGTVIGVVDIGLDITNRVKYQQELARRREYLTKLLTDAQEELSRWKK